MKAGAKQQGHVAVASYLHVSRDLPQMPDSKFAAELFLAAVSAIPPVWAAAILAVKSSLAVFRLTLVTGGDG